MIWFVFALILLIAAAILLYPFFFGSYASDQSPASGLDIYKAQLDELDADQARGSITAAEAEPVRLEIQRRILRAGREQAGADRLVTGKQGLLAGVLLVLFVGGAAGLYAELGSPDLPSKPLALRDIAEEKQALSGNNLQDMVKQLALKLQQQPENVDGWVLLARTLTRMQRFDDAAKTYLQAAKVAPGDVDLYVGAGENFYFHANRNVSDDALTAFRKAQTIAPDHPGVRYYLALRDAQDGNTARALDAWLELYEDSDANAPFMAILRRNIESAATETGRTVTAILSKKQDAPRPVMPGPTQEQREAAAEMSAADRQEMIESMVARLADRMVDEPSFDGLMRLGKAYSTLSKLEESAGAYGQAAALKPKDPLPLIMQALALVQNAPAGSPPSENAIAVYQKVLALDDTVAEAHWYVGLSYAVAGRKEDALAHWQKILKLVPNDAPLYDNVSKAIKSLSQSN
jgi:cytochrome c-type biogenesis protein CcmH